MAERGGHQVGAIRRARSPTDGEGSGEVLKRCETLKDTLLERVEKGRLQR